MPEQHIVHRMAPNNIHVEAETPMGQPSTFQEDPQASPMQWQAAPKRDEYKADQSNSQSRTTYQPRALDCATRQTGCFGRHDPAE